MSVNHFSSSLTLLISLFWREIKYGSNASQVVTVKFSGRKCLGGFVIFADGVIV
jgi:hypothetical protein